MIQKPKLDALRARIARKEASAARRWPAAPLGAEALDGALPDGGLPTGVVHELVPGAYGDFAAALGFGAGALIRLLKARPGLVLWTLPAHLIQREGALYPLGLAALGIDPNRLIQVRVPKPQHVLWVLEEALGQPAITAVMGVLPRDDKTYDFTASRRLVLRAGETGVTPLLVHDGPAPAQSTAADMRWRISSAVSAPVPRHGQTRSGLSAPRWRVELAKSKRSRPGAWTIEWNHETLSFRMAAALGDGTPRADADQHQWAVA